MLENIKKSCLLLASVILLTSMHSTAQTSELWMRNGKKLTISSFDADTSGYYDGKIRFVDSKGKNKTRYLEDVFSVIDASGSETVFYKPNAEFGEVLSPELMRQYVIGMGDGQKAHISPLILLGGVFSGLVGAFVPQPKINLGGNSMALPIGVLVPAAYVGIIGATPPNAESLKNKLPQKSGNEHYLMGYQEGIRKKRFRHGILGAGLGFLTGVIVVATAN